MNYRYRLRFAKMGRARFLSHLELMTLLLRAFRQAELPFRFSQGFRPHPRISFAHATSVGMESRSEYADLHLREPLKDPREACRRIGGFLPQGLAVFDLHILAPNRAAVSELIRGFRYEAVLPLDLFPDAAAVLPPRIDGFLQAAAFTIARNGDDLSATRDIRPFFFALSWYPDTRTVAWTVAMTPAGSVRSLDLFTQVLGLEAEKARQILVVKTDTLLRNETPRSCGSP